MVVWLLAVTIHERTVNEHDPKLVTRDGRWNSDLGGRCYVNIMLTLWEQRLLLFFRLVQALHPPIFFGVVWLSFQSAWVGDNPDPYPKTQLLIAAFFAVRIGIYLFERRIKRTAGIRSLRENFGYDWAKGLKLHKHIHSTVYRKGMAVLPEWAHSTQKHKQWKIRCLDPYIPYDMTFGAWWESSREYIGIICFILFLYLLFGQRDLVDKFLDIFF